MTSADPALRPMRVLDLDLDFFLADCCPLAPMGVRPALSGYEPWPAADVAAFLEVNCGLSASQPVPGRVFDTHDNALLFWREQMQKGALCAPFSVTHVDAHSDLGIGFPGPGAVLDGVLPLPPAIRDDPARYYARRQLDEANYLLYALAFRYVSALDNVRNPRSRPDLPGVLFPEGGRDTIRLTSFAARLMEGKNGPEPAIPYREFPDPAAYRADAPFDFVTLARSPRYAPAEADALIPVIARYLSPV